MKNSLSGRYRYNAPKFTQGNPMETRDSNGNILADGDTVMTVKDLKVKGMPKTLKRGEAIKGIRLTSNANEVECRIGKSTVVLKTEFLKKA